MFNQSDCWNEIVNDYSARIGLQEQKRISLCFMIIFDIGLILNEYLWNLMAAN